VITLPSGRLPYVFLTPAPWRSPVKSPHIHAAWLCVCLSLGLAESTAAQAPPYDAPPPVAPPYYRVRYEASSSEGALAFPVQYTVWIPKDVKTLRCVIVHQHGCGEGSCKSGQTGAFDLHWQALAAKHDAALLAPSYEQPQDAECQLWCDPRNGSGKAFQQALRELGAEAGHPELATIPWALWGHSGGGHWCGGMVMQHPDRVAAAWLRSGVPLIEADPSRPQIKPHPLAEAALAVPMMCNPGTQEGVTVKDGRFAGVWPANETFFRAVRGRGGLIGVAVDPLTAHECGNQRYLAIPWLDACLTARLPEQPGDPLRPMPARSAWVAPLLGHEATPADTANGAPLEAIWLPNEAIARMWEAYVRDTAVPDTSPPPAPTHVLRTGNTLTWTAHADLESGLAQFLILRDGEEIATVPEQPQNRFGRPLFQGLQYSDTPELPLQQMTYTDESAMPGAKHEYRVIAINTAGLRSSHSTVAELSESL
jgi:pimeloyl-ACP methyl ester carboxylesterase